jgi:hypothetical protein
VLLLNECLLLLLFISLSTQSGNFWIQPSTLQFKTENCDLLMSVGVRSSARVGAFHSVIKSLSGGGSLP